MNVNISPSPTGKVSARGQKERHELCLIFKSPMNNPYLSTEPFAGIESH